MKMTLNQAIKHLKGLENNNPSFNGMVIFCKDSKEYVVCDLSDNTHLHISDHLEDCIKWERDIFKEV